MPASLGRHSYIRLDERRFRADRRAVAARRSSPPGTTRSPIASPTGRRGSTGSRRARGSSGCCSLSAGAGRGARARDRGGRARRAGSSRTRARLRRRRLRRAAARARGGACPGATLIQGDLLDVELRRASFDAVCRVLRPRTTSRATSSARSSGASAGWLRPGGYLLASSARTTTGVARRVARRRRCSSAASRRRRTSARPRRRPRARRVRGRDDGRARGRGAVPVGAGATARIGSRAVEIRTVGVVGLGTMGAGIAQVCVEAGVEIVGREVAAEPGEPPAGGSTTSSRARSRRASSSQEDKDAAVGRLTRDDRARRPRRRATSSSRPPSRTSAVKRRAVARARSQLLRPDAIVATNTSALSVTEIAAAYARPERVVGMHFFNPAPLMRLVEIVRARSAPTRTPSRRRTRSPQSLGKEPIRCNDTPGFVVNRILIPLLNDCVRVLDEARVSRRTSTRRCGSARGGRWARARSST